MTLARSLAFDNAGSSMEARMAMIAITTNSSINVNALAAGIARWDFPGTTDISIDLIFLYIYEVITNLIFDMILS
jgi:hypothetical protein